LTFEQGGPVTFSAREALVWPAMILAGLALGGYAFGAWPETASNPPPARATPDPGRALAGTAGSAYLGDIFVYELPSTMLIDAIMATPQPVDAH
jgi:hypothetical protein